MAKGHRRHERPYKAHREATRTARQKGSKNERTDKTVKKLIQLKEVITMLKRFLNLFKKSKKQAHHMQIIESAIHEVDTHKQTYKMAIKYYSLKD